MLPDWPVTKRLIVDAYEEYMRKVTLQLCPIFAQIPSVAVHEGDGTLIERADGSSDDSPFHRAEAAFQIDIEDIKILRLPDMFGKLTPAIEQLAKEKMQHLLETLEAGTRRVGNVIDGEGKPISAEKILDLFDKIAISFDPNGRPQMPTGLAGGAQAEAYRVQLARIDTEPALKARMKQIIDRKREEWRAGEAHRVLVG